MARTYKTRGEALADPASNLSKFMARAAETQKRNDAVIAALMAQGLTREQAWTEALRGARKAQA